MRYLYENNNIIYASCDNCGRVLKFKKYELDQVSTGVECFCGECSNKIAGLPLPEKKTTSVNNQNFSNTYTQPVYSVPRCPTCGSTNVEKISLTSKAVGGAMFGIFSSNIRNTYKCKKCGYKW